MKEEETCGRLSEAYVGTKILDIGEYTASGFLVSVTDMEGRTIVPTVFVYSEGTSSMFKGIGDALLGTIKRKRATLVSNLERLDAVVDAHS